MQNRDVPVERNASGSKNPFNPRLAAYLERVRKILGSWTEPLIVAYGTYACSPEQDSLERFLFLCSEAALKLTHATGSAIAVVNGPEFIYVRSAGDFWTVAGTRVRVEAGFPGACLKSAQPFLSNHVAHDALIDPAVRDQGIRSLLAVPMVSNNYVVGFVEACSRHDNLFAVSDVLSVQFIAALASNVLSHLHGQGRKYRRRISLDVADASKRNPDEPLQNASADPVPTSAPGMQDSKVAPSAMQSHVVAERQDPGSQIRLTGSLQPGSTTLEPQKPAESQLLDRELERRSHSRFLVSSLTYVNLGEDNGGILLDISDAGFSVQTALPMDPTAPPLRRARFTGECEFAADCELLWEQTGVVGCRFLNLPSNLRARLQEWMTANGIGEVTPRELPQAECAQTANPTLAKLDELRSMLLNSKLTKLVAAK